MRRVRSDTTNRLLAFGTAMRASQRSMTCSGSERGLSSSFTSNAMQVARRWQGAGKVMGTVKKVDDGTVVYEKWALQKGTRSRLTHAMPAVHPLAWEYVDGLHKRYRSLLALLESPDALANAANGKSPEDFLRATVKNKTSPATVFSWIRWQQIFQTEIDDTTEVADTIQLLDAAVKELDGLNSSQHPSSADMTACQREELAALYTEEVEALVAKLCDMEELILRIVRRRVDASDVLGSSSRTWTIECVGKAGGTEASLFAVELLEFLRHYALNVREWQAERVMDDNGLGQLVAHPEKLRIIGDGVYRHLRHEIGVHKVQRVPVTDQDGKMQTSTAVVTMTPILDPITVDVREADCNVDFVRGSGPGGQGMQSSSNCCVMTHRPSGITVKCHQSRSALGNKELALQTIAQQILAKRVRESQSAHNAAWENQWFSGERSEKMRTYNFPQNRVTDHRLGRDYPLGSFMDVGASTSLLGQLHGELNQAADRTTVDAMLKKYLDGEFGSDAV